LNGGPAAEAAHEVGEIGEAHVEGHLGDCALAGLAIRLRERRAVQRISATGVTTT
jgi:hypothetical protein